MARLAVNVDHVATVRQVRGIRQPDPVLAAALAELAGAEGIICHLREDRRHIQDLDLEILRHTVKTRLNMEMAAVDEMAQIALRVRPDLITLVPEKREELTTEGGLNVRARPEHYRRIAESMRAAGIHVSFFLDPDPGQIKMAHQCAADIVEIHTGHYAEAQNEMEASERFSLIAHAVDTAAEMNLRISAGHGLDYRNIHRFKALPRIEEYSIGHSIVARAVFVGIGQAVREMVELVKGF